MRRGSGSITVEVVNDEVVVRNGEPVEVTYSIDIDYRWSYDPGCKHKANGDPGEPPEFDFEAEYINDTFIFEDDEIVLTEDEKQQLIDKAIEEVESNPDDYIDFDEAL